MTQSKIATTSKLHRFCSFTTIESSKKAGREARSIEGSIDQAISAHAACTEARPCVHTHCVPATMNKRATYCVTSRRIRAHIHAYTRRLIGLASSRRTNLFTMYTVESNGRGGTDRATHAIHDYIPEVTPCRARAQPPRKIESRQPPGRIHLVIIARS